MLEMYQEIPLFLLFKVISVVGLAIFFGLPLFLSSLPLCDWDSDEFELKPRPGMLRISVAMVLGLTSVTIWTFSFGQSTDNMFKSIRSVCYTTLLESFSEHLSARKEQVAKSASAVRTNQEVRIIRFRLESFTMPKHVYVNLTELKTGHSFPRLYVAKHCKQASQLKRGDEYNILVQPYTLSGSPGVVRYEFLNMATTFCK